MYRFLLIVIFIFCTPEAISAAQGDKPYHILEYHIRLAGIPLGAKSRIQVTGPPEHRIVHNEVRSFFANNKHISEFMLDQCDFRQVRYSNIGRVLGWTFNDKIEFNWQQKTISYSGKQKSEEFNFEDEIFVDKLSQYGVIACQLRDNQSIFILSYVDNVIAHYRFEVTGRETLSTPAGNFETIRLISSPVASKKKKTDKKNIAVSYWLAPRLDYYPIKIQSRVLGLPFTIKLNKVINQSGTSNR